MDFKPRIEINAKRLKSRPGEEIEDGEISTILFLGEKSTVHV